MNKSIEHIFLALSSFDTKELKAYASHTKFKELRDKYKIEDFQKTLSNYKMDEYVEPLYNYMIVTFNKHMDYKRNEQSSADHKRQELIYQENLVNLLKIFQTKNSIKSIIIKCRKSFHQEPVNVRDQDVLNSMTKSAVYTIWEKIKQLELNMFSLTNEEAIEAINNQLDIEWMKSWMESMGFIDPNYASFTLDKFEEFFKALGWKLVIPEACEKLKQEFISDYIYDHRYDLPLDLKTIEKILGSIQEKKSKRGRKEDTFSLKSIAYILNILIHSEQYLSNIDIEAIHDVKMSDDDHYFIHDVLVFFNFIETYRDIPKNEKILKKRIRKILYDYKDPAGINDIDEKFRILKHDLSHSV
jgi:hypothetical protein